MEAIKPTLRPKEFDAPAIGSLAHLYRGEVYRSTMWRTRLDATTNWAVVTFSTQNASPLPLLLAGILCIVFLMFEARRYRYFNVWRARARWMEKNFYAPMLRGESLKPDASWPQVLARDYVEPRHHITFARAPSWYVLEQILPPQPPSFVTKRTSAGSPLEVWFQPESGRAYQHV